MKPKRKKILVGGAVVAASAALFVGLASSGAISLSNNRTPGETVKPVVIPGVKNATPVAETEEEQVAREQAFTYVPANAMLVAQVNASKLDDKQKADWWNWYRQMSPHPQSLPKDISPAAGLENIVLSYYPSEKDEFSELYMFDYNYVFTFDTVENRDNAVTELYKVTKRDEAVGTAGAAEVRIVDNDKAPMIVYAPVSAFTEIEEFEKAAQAKEAEKAANPLLQQIPLMKEDAPTLYMNPDAFLDSYTQRSDDAGGIYQSFGQAVRESIFGAKEGQASPKWIGTSDDFGKTWVSLGDPAENYATYSSIEPSKIQEVSDRVFSEIMSGIINEKIPEGQEFPGYAYGSIEFDVDEGLKGSVSIASPKEESVYGEVKSIYEGGSNVIAEPSSPEEFVFVFSPRSFHSWYVATGLYTQVSTVTLRSTPEKSVISFEFDDLAHQ